MKGRARPDVIIAAQKIPARAVWLRKPFYRRRQQFVGCFAGRHDTRLRRKPLELRGVDERHPSLRGPRDEVSRKTGQHADDAIHALVFECVMRSSACALAGLSSVDDAQFDRTAPDTGNLVDFVHGQTAAGLGRGGP